MTSDPISIVVLAHNEALTIEKEVRQLHEKIVCVLPGSEIIVGEDGSQDGTDRILRSLVSELGICHSTDSESRFRRGYAAAYSDAMRRVKNNYIFFSDTGNKYSLDDFWRLYELRHHYDLIVGYRKNRKDALYRHWLTAGYNAWVRFYFRTNLIHDADSSFRLFNRSVLELVIAPGLFFRELIGSEVLLKAVILHRLKYKEIPVDYYARIGPSRGMPLNKIPSKIKSVLADLKTLKKQCQPRRSFHG